MIRPCVPNVYLIYGMFSFWAFILPVFSGCPNREVPISNPICGNAIIEAGESCDDGNLVNEGCPYGDLRLCTFCDATCQVVAGQTSYCGDGRIDSDQGETCDDGNVQTEVCLYGEESCFVCDVSCQQIVGTTSSCGDGVIATEEGEACDSGSVIDTACPYGSTGCTVCDEFCQEIPGEASFCGDGMIDEINGETCDDGNTVIESCAYGEAGCIVCNERCQLIEGPSAFCGDGQIDSLHDEICDDGADNNDEHPWACRTTCMMPEKYPGACAINYDDGQNGSVDLSFSNTFNDLGYLTKQEARNENGDLLLQININYDDKGNRLNYRKDMDGDGQDDFTTTSTFNADGKILTHLQDGNEEEGGADGEPDYAVTLTYNSNGFQVSFIEDTNGDGSVDYRETVTEHDEEGNWIKADVDIDGDGQEAMTFYSCSRNENGDITLYEIRNDEGRLNERRVITYDDENHPLVYEIDSNGDGSIDERTTITYNENKDQLTYKWDQGDDGVIDYNLESTYDTQNNLVSMKSDGDPVEGGADGAWNVVYVLTYDANGYRQLLTRDDQDDGTINYSEVTQYDSQGNLIRLEIDEDGNGSFDYVEISTHDENGNLLSQSTVDSETSLLASFFFDCWR